MHDRTLSVALCAAVTLACGAVACKTAVVSVEQSPETSQAPQAPLAPAWSVDLGPQGGHVHDTSRERPAIERVGDVWVLVSPGPQSHVLDPATGRVLRALDNAAFVIMNGHLLDWDAKGRVSERDPRTMEALWSVDLAALIAGSDSVQWIPHEDLTTATKHYLERLQIDMDARTVFVQYTDDTHARSAGYSAAVLNAVDRDTGRLRWRETARVAPMGGPSRHIVGEREVVWMQLVKRAEHGRRVEVRERDTGKLRCATTLDSSFLIAVEGRRALFSAWKTAFVMSLDDCTYRTLAGDGRALVDGDVLLADPHSAWLKRADGDSGEVRWEIVWERLPERFDAPSGRPPAPEHARVHADRAKGLVTWFDWETGAVFDRIYVGSKHQALATTAQGAMVLWWHDGTVEAVRQPVPTRDVTVRGRVEIDPASVPFAHLRVACADDRLSALGWSWNRYRWYTPEMEVVDVGPQGHFECTTRARYAVDVRVIANAADTKAIHKALSATGAQGPCVRFNDGILTSVPVSPTCERSPVVLNVNASLDAYYCGDSEGLCPPEDCYWHPTEAY